MGLPDNIVRESKDSVKAAIRNSGYPFPFERITVNLAPAALKKEGAGFDLPIAAGILAALGIVNSEKAAGIVFCGELSLDGRVKPAAFRWQSWRGIPDTKISSYRSQTHRRPLS